MELPNAHASASDQPAAHPRAPTTPWPVPPGTPALLFGGSFDPPHAAHTELATAARDALFGTDGWLIYVPAGRNPHKPTGPRVSDTHRVAMLELAIRGIERAAVWTDEIDRAVHDERAPSPSYWVDTLERALGVAGDTAPLRFLIGADQALSFSRWHNHERILQLAQPAVILRDPCPNRESFRRQLLESGLDPAAWMPRVVETELHRAASTSIRSIIAAGHEPGDIIHAAVSDYIRNNGLYKGLD